jgi:hypothetical protein
MITALHWNEAPSDADSNVLAEGLPGAGLESTFAGSTVNVQFMVKDLATSIIYDFGCKSSPTTSRTHTRYCATD